jgi:Glyoxalase-like domain
VLRIDHVVYAVRDLDEAARRFRRDHGLDSTPGGRHPGWGTANRIVPLGDDYIEIIAVVDDGVASRTSFGRSVLERTEHGDGWLAICAATDDLDAVARRLGLDVTGGVRERPDGSELRWRSAGLEDPRREPFMPFFIAWEGPADAHPARVRAGHGVRVRGVARIDVGGDGDALRSWLGGEELPIRVSNGSRGILSVALVTHDAELAIS